MDHLKSRSRDDFLTAGVVRPICVSSGTRQLAVAVLDVSGSMFGQKLTDANAAAAALLAELAAPTNKDGFDFALVAYGTQPATILAPRTATAIAPHELQVSVSLGGMTNFEAAIVESRRIIDSALACEARQLRPVVVFLTDGQRTAGGDPAPVAAQLRQFADVVAIAFGGDADIVALTKIASSPQHVARCRTGPELRAYFAAVGRTMSQSRARGTAASTALATIGSGGRP